VSGFFKFFLLIVLGGSWAGSLETTSGIKSGIGTTDI